MFKVAYAADDDWTNHLWAESITEFLQALIGILLIFAVPLVVLALIHAGFRYVTAQGNPTKISEAHRMLTYALIGALIIFGAEIIGGVISETVKSFM